MAHKQIYYSDKYSDEQYEYRHVMLPRELSKQVPKSHLMSEEEWRRLGVQQSLGWVHYMIHEPDRFNKPTKKKSTEATKPESRPVPTFEASILDFHKSQSLGSSEILNVHHKSTPEDTSAKSKASPKASNEAGANIIPSSLDGRGPEDGSAQPHVSWAVILSQPPKKVVSSPASEGLSRGKGKQESELKESERKNVASETEPEEESEKKKKKKKKKKKLKSPTDVERPQSESNIIQEPPKIEFYTGQSFIGTANKCKWIHVEKNNHVFPYTLVGPDLDTFLELNIETAIDNQDVEEFPHLGAASDRRNRVGPQTPPFTSAVRKQSEICLSEEPCDSWSPWLDETPKVDGLSGKQASPSVLERKRTQIILKEREQRKQQHLLEQKAAPKGEDNVSQTAGNVTENATLLQDSQAAVPVTQVAEGFLEHMGIKESKESSVTSKQLTATLPKIHSRNFRDYCSQVLSKEVDSCVTDLLKELVRFQDRLYQKDPVKAKIKRRLVMGLREVLKHLKLKKLKCVIISPNCEKIQSKGGLDETVHNIIDCACEQNIPFVFALNRKALGRCVNKAVPVSVVGIFSYDGAQDHFHRMVQLTTEARKAYKDMIAALEEEAKAGLKETQPSILTPESEKNGFLETCKTSPKDSDEDVPNYIKVWKRKLEEEYNPYALELEKSITGDMAILNLEDHQ
ncbi:selenocysteine insertion sequence-binding protein 2 [Turdus rufiventris]|nr:selenocysteine insertion sequence-binding protein 2 [Turdus rufiventris]